jgi:hypothetical protein
LVWFGLVWFGLVVWLFGCLVSLDWFGLDWFGLVWFGGLVARQIFQNKVFFFTSWGSFPYKKEKEKFL